MPTTYPPGATLRCACGEVVGSIAKVSGHRGRSRRPLCKLDPEILDEVQIAAFEAGTLAPPPPRTDPPPTLGGVDPGGPGDPVPPPPPIPPDPGVTFVGEPPPPSPPASPVRVAEAPPAPPTNGARPVARVAAGPRASAAARGVESLELREPSPGQVGAEAAPPMIRSVVEIPVIVHAMYDAARTNPTLRYQGTFSEFLAECTLAAFDVIGYKMALVRSAPVVVPGYVDGVTGT